jgi:chromate transport protein ChrA
LTPQPTIKNLFLAFLKLGLTAFGGPAMIAHIREMSVHRNKWLDGKAFNAFSRIITMCTRHHMGTSHPQNELRTG